MDIHGGKAVQEGPLNYLGSFYRAVPVGITVEGANIVTRSLIQFGQGAIRSHPYLLKEMQALEDPDRARGLDAFDRAFWGHVGHSIANAIARLGPGLDRRPASRRRRPPAMRARFYKPLGRYAAAFALAADIALLTLGGALKRREMISARFGDILSELYLLSAALKRWEDEGRQQADLPLLAMVHGKRLRHHRDRASTRSSPTSPIVRRRGCCASCCCRCGRRRHGPSDRLTQACAVILLEPSATRDRLTVDIFHGSGDEDVARLERAFELVIARPSRCAIACARRVSATSRKARQQGMINDAEAAQLEAAAKAVAEVVAVDDFAPEELSPRRASQGGVLSPAMSRPTARGIAAARSISSTAAARPSSRRADGPARLRRSISRSPADGRCCCASRFAPMRSMRSSSAASTSSPTR